MSEVAASPGKNFVGEGGRQLSNLETEAQPAVAVAWLLRDIHPRLPSRGFQDPGSCFMYLCLRSALMYRVQSGYEPKIQKIIKQMSTFSGHSSLMVSSTFADQPLGAVTQMKGWNTRLRNSSNTYRRVSVLSSHTGLHCIPIPHIIWNFH